MNLSERIKWALEREGMSQIELARKVGVAAPSVHGWLTGKAKFLRGENLLRAAQALNVNQQWLATGQGLPDNPSTSTIPGAIKVTTEADDPHSYRIQKVQLQLRAGVTGFQTVPEIHDGGTINLPKNWVDRKGFFPETLVAISVVGDSMEPKLYEGDVVVINTSDRKLADGEVFAVNYEGEAVIKRLVRERGSWWLFSDNPDQIKHRPRGCRDGECIIIGRVVWKGSERI